MCSAWCACERRSRLQHPALTRRPAVAGHDMLSLLFAFMDELLFLFHTEEFACKDLRIIEFDQTRWRIRAQACVRAAASPRFGPTPHSLTCRHPASRQGERFDLAKHPQGTEVKAITYSNMQVHEPREEDGRVDVYVIVDI